MPIRRGLSGTERQIRLPIAALIIPTRYWKVVISRREHRDEPHWFTHVQKIQVAAFAFQITQVFFIFLSTCFFRSYTCLHSRFFFMTVFVACQRPTRSKIDVGAIFAGGKDALYRGFADQLLSGFALSVIPP
jgi:hypothetical protein